MRNNDTELWVCGLCCESVNEGQPTVRIAADSAMSDGGGGCESLMNREVLVFALFHSKCVVETVHNDDCDEVDYIEEARDIMREAPLCEDCRLQIFEPEQAKRSHLVLLQGGIQG